MLPLPQRSPWHRSPSPQAPWAGRPSLTRLQLEVLGGQGLPGQGQGHHGLQVWHMLLHVRRGVAEAVGQQLLRGGSRREHQLAPCDIVTHREVTRLLQDFHLKHTGKNGSFGILLAVQPLFDGVSHREYEPLAGFLSCNPL